MVPNIVWWGGVDPKQGPFISFRLYTYALEYESTKHFRDLYDDPAVFWKVVERMSKEEVQEGWDIALTLQDDATRNMGTAIDSILIHGEISK